MQNPNPSEIVALIARHQPRLRGLVRCLLVRSSDMEDVLQEVNSVLWQKASEFQAGTDFWAWASQIARFKALNHIRKYSRDRLVFDDELLNEIADLAHERLTQIDHRRDALEGCLNELPPLQRLLRLPLAKRRSLCGVQRQRDQFHFPNAWRYRDYAIDSCNRDGQLDQFVGEQIAGALLPAEDDYRRAELIIATGFLALIPSRTSSETQSKSKWIWWIIRSTRTRKPFSVTRLHARDAMIIGSIRFLTRIGEVIIERQLYRYRLRAGALIVDNKTVDLLRYCAWMHVVRHSPRTTNGVDSYDSMKERLGERTTTITDLTVRWTPTPVGVCTSLCCFRYGCASAPTASDNLPIAVT